MAFPLGGGHLLSAQSGCLTSRFEMLARRRRQVLAAPQLHGADVAPRAEADWRPWNTVELAGLANQQGVTSRDCHLHRHQEHDG